MDRCGEEKGTYRTAFQHTTADLRARGEPKPLVLQSAIGLPQITQIHATLGGHGPVLDEFQHLVLDVGVEQGAFRLEQGDEIVHELAGGDLGQEVGAAVFHAGICQLDGGDVVSSRRVLLERAGGSDQL